MRSSDVETRGCGRQMKTGRDHLLYRLYGAPLTGSLQIHDGKSLRTIATFTVGLEPVAFANKDWYRPGSAK